MKISIAGYSFHGLLAAGQMNVFSYLESCRYRYQLNTADIWAGLMGKDPAAYLQPEFIQQVKTALVDRDLTLVNYHADGCHPWDDDPQVRERNLALAEQHIAAAEKLGASTVRIDTGGRERHWSDEAFDYIAKTFSKWAKRAHEKGYRIGPETHWGADNHADNQLKLAKAVNSPGYGILLHMSKDVDGSPDDYDRALAPYAMHTHIDQRTTYSRCEKAIRILMEAGYKGALGVEHHSAANEYVEVAAQLAQVKRTLTLINDPGTKERYSKNPLLGF